MQNLDDGGDTGHHDGEGGNARHKESLNNAHFPYPSDHSKYDVRTARD